MRTKIAILIIALSFSLDACVAQTLRETLRTSDQMVTEAKAVIVELSVDDVKRMIDNKEQIIILDVRDKDEFESGWIPGAINLSRGMLEFKISALIPDKNTTVIVYCGIDLRGPLAVRTLNEMGYRKAVNMIGGLKAWKAAGFPIAKQR